MHDQQQHSDVIGIDDGDIVTAIAGLSRRLIPLLVALSRRDDPHLVASLEKMVEAGEAHVELTTTFETPNAVVLRVVRDSDLQPIAELQRYPLLTRQDAH